ncbi:MAG: ABC transporter ATP-binding protein [Desulfobacteraceae bacterium]|jgi:branched-chain amino acid transport system ATP-binding protein
MLVAENLKKYFGDVRAVDDVSFTIDEGEVVSLVGSNGAGKTTLVNLISGYLVPDSGKIVFGNRTITHASAYKRIKMGVGRSFQGASLFENATVLDNIRISLFSRYGKIKRGLLPANRYRDITSESSEILAIFNISDKSSLTTGDLSEGEKKVLDVAIAFALKSKLLLLDEPTSGVATGDKFKIMDTIVSAVRKENVSTLIIEHDMDIVTDYSDKVLVMHQGRVIARGKPDEVMGSEIVRTTLFGIGA